MNDRLEMITIFVLVISSALNTFLIIKYAMRIIKLENRISRLETKFTKKMT